MKNKITRRDFLNGTQVAIGASLLGPWTEAFGSIDPGFSLGPNYYPPAKSGMRGSHPGSWETMHARVMGSTWQRGAPEGEYDLVVVGGGISGLSAAHFYRQENPGARILILDNYDDFGGHAKRNEFSFGDNTRIAYGGTESIDTPSGYTDVARRVLRDIGIETERFYKYFDQELYDSMNLSYAIAFDSETYGERKLVRGYGRRPWQEFADEAPLNEQARADLVRAFTSDTDYLPGMTQEEKIELLTNINYRDFLENYVKVDYQVLEMFQRWGMSYWCVGMDEVRAIEILGYGDGGPLPGLDHTIALQNERAGEPYIFHFPDGNASVARLLVRSMIPAAVPGSTMEDSVTARIDYSALDRDDNDVRIRLNSTVVNAVHTRDSQAVDVTYVHRGDAHTVRARHCVMGCYNGSVPFICPELPAVQRENLGYGVKVPITYTKVSVPHWRWFADLGIRFVYYTNDFFKQVELDYPVSIGDYEFGSSPDDPMTLHMCYVPYFDDIQGPDQWRAGQQRLLETPFATFEDHVKDQLDQALAGAGFDADRDINAITVNRWPHGYAYRGDHLWEPEYASEDEKPWVIGRQPYGRIAIANSDSGAAANTNMAITQAYRAVRELADA